MTYAERQAARNEALQEAADTIREWEPNAVKSSMWQEAQTAAIKALAGMIEGMKRT